MYFKANLEIEEKDEKVLFIAALNIVQAMDITRKIRKSRIKILKPITYEEYMQGIDLKYQP
jgi:hypothetical protein